jgi:ABC-type sugar transport system substrate-binding protein
MKPISALKTTLLRRRRFGAMAAAPAYAASHSVGACLITKTDTNPFFVKMKEGAEAKAEELGVSLKSYAGKIDGDHETQVAAIETCIADGAKGILLTASDTSSIVPAVQQARDAGLLVIALDTPLDPIDAADATFATDNFLAGELIGKWAAATPRRRGRQRQDRHARPGRQPADRRRAARPGLPAPASASTEAIRTSGAMRTIRASSATTSPPATRKAAAGPWKTFLPRIR